VGLNADFDLRDEVVVITGASRGLGAGMASWLAAHGARLGVCARQMPAVSDGHGDRVVAASVDVRDPDAVGTFADSVLDRLGPPTLWVNNAGVLEPIVKVRDLDYDSLFDHMAINVGGVLNGTRAFLRLLRASGTQGTLVNISSGAARAGRAGWAAYCAGKAAVDRITETVALEEGDHLRLALAVSPGVVDTDMQALIRSQSEDVQPDVEWFRERHREGELSSPAWVAENILKWHLGPEKPEAVVCRVPPEPARHQPSPGIPPFIED
jgi:benzil reductase ((S)-benzoin forming)